jgi:hypothetical protein
MTEAGFFFLRSAAVSAILVVLLLAHTTLGLTFGVIGDWGMGGFPSGWYPEIRSTMQYNEMSEFLGVNFTISCGDNIYCGNVFECMQNSFELGFKSQGPFFPSVGNHDNPGPQMEYTKRSKRWVFPARYYTVKMPIDETSYTVQIFAVDTTDGGLGGGGQFQWLTSELAKSDARWKFIFGHYPTVGSGRHKRVGTVGRIHGIMSDYNAQAFFVGHDHIVEVSNVGGRLHGLSGGMSRGGMMLRGIGGGFRKFTLTSPSEYNTWKTDWPSHGFLTGDLSPNVLNLHAFDSNGGMTYELSLTWDWLKKVGSMPAAQQQEWPAPDIVLQAYKDEVKLPRGCGGGIIFTPDGPQPSAIQGNCAGPTPAPSPSPPTAPVPPTPQPVPTPAPIVTLAQEQLTNPPEAQRAVPAYVKYAVSTECAPCNGQPTIDVPFTVAILGMSVSSLCRMFLTTSPVGCDIIDKPQLLAGTAVLSRQVNLVTFTVSGLSTEAYVCFSVDKGATYSRLLRIDDVFESPEFIVNPPLGFVPNTTAPLPPSSLEAAGSASAAPGSSQQPQMQTVNSGHSSAVLIFVGVVCVVAGGVGSVYLANIIKR